MTPKPPPFDPSSWVELVPRGRPLIDKVHVHPTTLAALKLGASEPDWDSLTGWALRMPMAPLVGVPVYEDDTLPEMGWAAYDRDGNRVAGHPDPVDDHDFMACAGCCGDPEHDRQWVAYEGGTEGDPVVAEETPDDGYPEHRF